MDTQQGHDDGQEEGIKIDRKRIAEKVAKCLALANSSNPHEAENAARQARNLMKKYGLSSTDVSVTGVKESATKAGTTSKPPFWLAALAATVARAFDCSVMNVTDKQQRSSEMNFIGVGEKAKLATYTYEVLARILRGERRKFMNSTYLLLLRTRKEKTRQADLFCQSWVARIERQVQIFAGNEAERKAIDDYLNLKWGRVNHYEKKAQESNGSNLDRFAIVSGAQSAGNVQLHKPVQEQAQAFLGAAAVTPG
jgi:hypothetical protein